MPTLAPELAKLLQCPNCCESLTQLNCTKCNTHFFEFGGVLSLLPAGQRQKRAWQHQLAVLNQQTQNSIQTLEALINKADVVSTTRERAHESLLVAEASERVINQIFNDAGIPAQWQQEFANTPLGSISEYYHHILQDWAWSPELINERLAPLLKLNSIPPSPNILVLGAGAGRLSWELHQLWNANITLATDINPLLLLVSHKLIVQQQALEFFELNNTPQIGKARTQSYTLTPPTDAGHKRDSWFAMAADAWRAPIKPNSLDVVVTAWFIDVHGGDNRELIPLIVRALKPGGIWVNSGPLLYANGTPFEAQYSREELLELMQLAGLEVEQEHLTEQQHLKSPLHVRSQTEQAWTFVAKKVETTNTDGAIPAWLIYHNIPVPNIFNAPEESHPLIDLIISKIDGDKSINQLCELVTHAAPKDLNVKETVVEVLAELGKNVKR